MDESLLGANPNAAIGRRLRRSRVLEGLTQAQLARLAGVTQQQVQRYEAGRHRLSSDRLLRVAACCRVSPEWLLTGRRSAGELFSAAAVGRDNLLMAPGGL